MLRSIPARILTGVVNADSIAPRSPSRGPFRAVRVTVPYERFRGLANSRSGPLARFNNVKNNTPARSGSLWLRARIPQHLSAIGASVPVVMITGHDEVGAQEACLAAGASSYLRKPLDRSVLLEAIERAISSFAERRAHS
jgi:ActR/RegA family two-component response regulator